ncbi:MAG: hypothetical protein P4L84_17670 [Isosphaeraceae bacterium]|nr:hypothetical protein [Isosphaeraceae bacterium]
MKLPEGAKALSTWGGEGSRQPSAHAVTRRLWACGLAAGLLAGVATGLAGECVLGWFDPNLPPASIHAPAAEQRDRAALIRRAEIEQVALALGLLGGIQGLALGVAGGLARRSVRAAALGGASGLILGTGAALVSSVGVMPYYMANRNLFGESFHAPLLLHAALGVPLGATGGLALGLGLGGWRRTVRATVGGLLGAALGTLLNEVVNAVLFPLSRTYQPLPDTWDSRVTSRVIVALFSALLAVAAIAHDAPDDQPSAR